MVVGVYVDVACAEVATVIEVAGGADTKVNRYRVVGLRDYFPG